MYRARPGNGTRSGTILENIEQHRAIRACSWAGEGDRTVGGEGKFLDIAISQVQGFGAPGVSGVGIGLATTIRDVHFTVQSSLLSSRNRLAGIAGVVDVAEADV